MTSLSTTINLVTPPSSPAPVAEDNAGDGERGKRKVKDESLPLYDSDDSVVEMSQPKKQRTLVSSSSDVASSSSCDQDDECTIIGSHGRNALVDFAHARWNCAKHRVHSTGWTADQYCQNCHCVICDTPVAQCANWADHWCADPSDNEVKRQRALVLKKGALPAARCSLAELKQIYATEVNIPLAQITLKNYQRQVVSWMLDNERNGFAVSSLVRFVDNKDDGPAPIQNIYGGVVALEMGMGKTACMIAACKTNTMPTLVVAPALTCVQWCAQFSQYAPELSNTMLYCTDQKKSEASLLHMDVIIVNSTSHLLDSVAKRVRRVIVDESHLVLEKGSGGEAVRFLHNISDFPNVKITWLVSGTPFGSSERMDDIVFYRQMRVLLKCPALSKHSWKFKEDATTADAKGLIMRMEKKQQYKDANGVSVSVMPIADIKYKTLKVGLSTEERELYGIAECIDGWTETRFKIENKRHTDEISKELASRFALRMLILGERISEFEEQAGKRLKQLFYNPDSEAPDIFFAKVDRMTYRIEQCCKKLKESSSKIDAVLEEINALKSHDPQFKAVVITESDGAGECIKRKLGSRVGVMQRPKGRTSLKEQKVLLDFQMGQFDVLVCSFESVRIGTNLDQAGAIYFVDSSVDDTEHKQAVARISRCGTKHSDLTATFVYVEGTLSEEIFKYHEDRRNGKSVEEAAARFEEDDPHDFSARRDFYKVQNGSAFDSMNFAAQRMPDSFLTDLMTSDMDINDMFKMICDEDDKSASENEYQVTLTFMQDKRPACYDIAKQIIVQHKASASSGDPIRIVFEVPDRPMNISMPEALVTTVKLNDEDAKILESVNSWHRNVPSVPVTLRMVLRNGHSVDMYKNISVIKASCSSCKWCGWRKVHEYTAPTIGCLPVMQYTADSSSVPNEKIMTVTSVNGMLQAQHKWGEHEDRIFQTEGFAAMNDRFNDHYEMARKVKKSMGVISYGLLYDKLNPRFFTDRPSVYEKVLVKLTNANINDTICFQYKERQYEAFVREIITTGLDWYAVAYVVESEKPESTIIIERHDILDMKRVVLIGGDALSIKDIIRALRNDPERTEQLKAILTRSDIQDAEKLEMASALVR